MKSSLSYQLLLYLGSYYCLGFIATEVLLLVYKSIILPYQSLTLVSEVIIISDNLELSEETVLIVCPPPHHGGSGDLPDAERLEGEPD